MADFEGPSFSLGFDLDLDLDLDDEDPELDLSADEKGIEDRKASSSGCTHFSAEGGDEREVYRGNLGEEPPERSEPFKRLRKGTPRKSPSDPSTPHAAVRFSNPVDDIEEFSSQEDCAIRDLLPSRQIHSSCSSSKIPLQGQRVLTTISSKKSKPPNITPSSRVSLPTNIEASSNKKVFPRITVSPLKRIQLLDSDSEDEPKVNRDLERESPWDFNLKTPAFDQFCEEHLQNCKTQRSKQQSTTTSSGIQDKRCLDHQPPCYEYFFHHDDRIQNLVRRRLPNFTPIGDAETLDYMGQFGERKGQATRKRGKEIRVSDNAVPKDAAKRRVSAVGSCGHWYTGQDGKKVYVSKNGKEMSGQMAYRQYRKEVGGHKKSGKKKAPGNSKKKPRR